MMLGHDNSVNRGGLRRAQDGAKIARVLDLIQGQEKSRLASQGRDREQVLERSVAGPGDPGHHTLMVRGPGDGRELIARAEGDLHAPCLVEREELGQRRPAPLGQDGDLLHAPAPRAQQLEHRIAAEERSFLVVHHDPSFHVVPSRVSSRVTPIAPNSSRRRSASAKSRRLRASWRRYTSESMRALSWGSTAGSGRRSRSSRPSTRAKITSSLTPMRKAPAPAAPWATWSRAA